jgi:hypothetical protein
VCRILKALAILFETKGAFALAPEFIDATVGSRRRRRWGRCVWQGKWQGTAGMG